MHRPHLLYPLICQCIFRLLLYLGYCKQWCTKHSCLNFHCPLPLNSLLWFKIQLKCCFLYDFSLFLSIIIVFFFWIPSGVCLIYFLFFYSLNLQHDLYPVWWVFSCSLLCFLFHSSLSVPWSLPLSKYMLWICHGPDIFLWMQRFMIINYVFEKLVITHSTDAHWASGMCWVMR